MLDGRFDPAFVQMFSETGRTARIVEKGVPAPVGPAMAALCGALVMFGTVCALILS